MKLQIELIIIFICSMMIHIHAQSKVVIGGGISMAYTDNPATSEKGQMINGYHGSLTARFGSTDWYIRPGLELHKMKMLPESTLNPFEDGPYMFILKVPAQLGLRLINTDNFGLRIQGGMQFSYVVSIQKNINNFNHNTITDTQFGALIGGGIDLGFVSIDVNFEKGLTELYTKTGYKSDYIIITAGISF
jgi:hypothetical protein